MSADERLHRLLALVPWVAAHDGPRIDEVCARFGCTSEELVDDLDLLFLCGLHPYTPDMLIDVDVDDGRVWIRYADYFSRPLRLTPVEGLALVAAGRTLLATPGADPAGPLARGLDKLATVLGIDAARAVEIALGAVPEEVMGPVREAAGRRRQVEIDYYAFGRDEWTRRVVDPYAVFSASGQWYLSAYCHMVDDERLFRLDRVRSVTVLDRGFEPPARPPELTVYRPRDDDPRVTLLLEPSARWVLEQYPVEGVEEAGGGRVRVTLAVSERPWLERLLLRLGPAGRVLDARDGTAAAGGHDAPADAPADVAADAACRLLGRYRGGSGSLGAG